VRGVGGLSCADAYRGCEWLRYVVFVGCWGGRCRVVRLPARLVGGRWFGWGHG